jgi:hypothetical protein
MKIPTKQTKQKSENQKIDEEIKKAYKELPSKKHNDFERLIRQFV